MEVTPPPQPPPWSEPSRSLSASSSPDSTTTALGLATTSSPSSSSASSGSTVRRESLPPATSPRSFSVTRHPRKALSVSISSPGAGAAARGYWSPPISSPLASPYASPPTSPRLGPVGLSSTPERNKSAAKKRRRPASPSTATNLDPPVARSTPRAGSSGSSPRSVGSGEGARPALGPQPSNSSPGVSSAANPLQRIRPAVRRAASANDLNAHEWRLAAGGGGAEGGEGSGRDASADGARPPSSGGATQEVALEQLRTAAPGPSKSPLPLSPLDTLQRPPSSPSSPPGSSASSSSSTGMFSLRHAQPFATSTGMQLLPSPSTFKASSATSPSSRATFEDYFNPSRGSHYSGFAFSPPLAASSPWISQAGPSSSSSSSGSSSAASRPAASKSQLTIRVDDDRATDAAAAAELPELDERSLTTPVGLPVGHASPSLLLGSPSSPPPRPPHTADPRRAMLPVPPRLVRQRSSSDPTPAYFSFSGVPAPLQLGKPLPPLPTSTSTGEQTFSSTSASSCSSSASSTSRVTEDTTVSCSSAATTTEACDTPPSLGLKFDPGEPTTTKPSRRPSKRRARPAVDGSAVETDSEGEQDAGSLPSTPVDSPQLVPAAPAHLESVGPDVRHNAAKASKLACQLWDLVEGEVAYTDDLVTLVQIYLHHLFMLPNFTAERRDVVARNTLDLLVLHRRFTQSLVAIASQEHLRSPDDQTAESLSDVDLDRAARRIARVFVEEAVDFAAYQDYCTGHEEALSVIRQHELTLQWMEYERKCSALSQQRPRTSLAALIEQEATSPPALSSRRSSFKWHASTPPALSPVTAVAPLADPERKKSRLMLRDLLIKPIQRICRYPLILDSVRTTKVVDLLSGELRPVGGADLEKALAVMKVAAGSVDEATRLKISLERSRMIRNRIEGHPALSRGVLSALGECLLVGSLDVIYHHPVHAPISTPIKIRYLSAFLYAGYFVLCKAKKGKSYTALHFLPLDRLDITEGQPGKSYLADSIRLQGEGYFLEVSAACAKEKDLWLTHLRSAQASPTLSLKSPPSSAPELFASRTISRRMSQGAPLVAKTSLSAKRNSGSTASGAPTAAAPASALEVDAAQSSPMELYIPAPPLGSVPAFSSRTSAAEATLPSVPGQMLFLRSPPSYRETVDKALADVMSESCSTARNNALRQGAVLFAPSSHRTTTSSSSIGAAVSSVRRKMAHQNGSMRRRSFLDIHGQPTVTEGRASVDKPAGSASSSASKLPRTKSELGLKRDNFLRRSSLMTHWPVDLKAVPAVPPLPPAEKAPVRTKSDRARSRTAPTTPIATTAALRALPARSESPTEMESPTAGAPAPAWSVPALAITPINPSPTKPTTAKASSSGVSRRTSVVESWFPRALTPAQQPLSPILSPNCAGDEEITFPRQSLDLPAAAAAPKVAPIPVPAPVPRPSILRRSLTSTFSRRRVKSDVDVPDLGFLSQAPRPAALSSSSDGLVNLAPVSPVSPLELCGEFGAISACEATEAGADASDPRTVGSSSRPGGFYIQSRSSSIASEDSAPDAHAVTPSSSVSNSAASSDDGLDAGSSAPLAGPVRRKSSRSVRFLKSFTFTPVN